MQMALPSISLRALHATDWSLFLALHQDAAVQRFICDMQDEAQIRSQFDGSLLPWTVYANHFMSEVILTAEQQAVGVIGLQSDWANRQVEVGFMLLPSAQGKGIAAAALQSMLARAFGQYGYHKITATVTDGNTASLQLLKRQGFVQEGVLRQNFWLGGRFVDDIRLGLLQSDWLASQSPELID